MSHKSGLDALHRKIDLRLLPYLFLLYIVAYLDRVNVSFAAPGLRQDLGFSSSVFGLGAGMFFAGYVLCEVPSNLILRRMGARRWIARIMVSWGVAACLMALVREPWSFHALRFLLGVAEAGFLPGIIYYLTLWYAPARRARAVALFMAATPVAGMIGGPLSGLLLGLDGLHGLAGWQWMFLLEGLPAVLLGVSVLRLLPDGPADAPWLERRERDLLATELAVDPAVEPGAPEKLSRVLLSLGRDRRVWLLSGAYFALCVGMYGLVMWMPTLIGEVLGQAATPMRVGLLSSVPYLGGALGMVLVGRHSDSTRERRWHTAGPLFLGAAGFLLSLLPIFMPGGWLGGTGPWWSLGCFTLATVGLWGMLGPFWTIPTGFLTGAAAAGGVALVNSIGNAGGFVGPALVGFVRDATGSHVTGFVFIAVVMVLGGCCVLLATLPRRAG
ncbi:MAG: MFS transporter [Humidesulfovibrio sp.]|uniref:MFS transporter n=1 Tax=Humidesulfovibrio sp. TaxID=2910988 RepID=UPI00273492DC|nr:MFS transporter [Humidesulfovibrio sp.]MDP2846638.1 MFS transporter [Humidesulfovibrio sp.]